MGIKARAAAAQAPKGTDYYLWELYYEAKVPQLAMFSDDYIRLYGMPTTGVPAVDNELSQQLITTFITPARMVELHQMGILIRIVKHEDTKMIYHHIQNHLQAWRDQVARGLNHGLAPQADLVAMDRFAHEIYDHARGYIKDTRPQGAFMRALDAKGHGDLTRSLDKPEAIQEANDEVSRESLAAVFKAVGARNRPAPESPTRTNRWM